jgi:two-component system KDP operon response regulator KdpE
VLHTTLFSTGFDVTEAATGEEALALARVVRYDVILLDLRMPGRSGIEICGELRRQFPRVAILILTVSNAEDEKIVALDSGADDYITKPFQLRELIARLRAVVRRNKNSEEEEAVILIGDVSLDASRHLVLKNGRTVHLTPKQFELLHFLMINAGKPVPHAKLLRSVWGPEYGNELEYLRTFVRQVRMKIEDDPANPKYLLT